MFIDYNSLVCPRAVWEEARRPFLPTIAGLSLGPESRGKHTRYHPRARRGSTLTWLNHHGQWDWAEAHWSEPMPNAMHLPTPTPTPTSADKRDHTKNQ
jgi:hypothetical protein